VGRTRGASQAVKVWAGCRVPATPQLSRGGCAKEKSGHGSDRDVTSHFLFLLKVGSSHKLADASNVPIPGCNMPSS
jgi:hypothetical protein